MSYRKKSPAVTRARVLAEKFRKELQSADPVTRTDAARRLQEHHPHYQDRDVRDIVAMTRYIPLDHAAHVVALEWGYDCYRDLEVELRTVAMHTYWVRVYDVGSYDKIGTLIIDAPNEVVAEAIALVEARRTYGYDSYEFIVELQDPETETLRPTGYLARLGEGAGSNIRTVGGDQHYRITFKGLDWGAEELVGLLSAEAVVALHGESNPKWRDFSAEDLVEELEALGWPRATFRQRSDDGAATLDVTVRFKGDEWEQIRPDLDAHVESGAILEIQQIDAPVQGDPAADRQVTPAEEGLAQSQPPLRAAVHFVGSRFAVDMGNDIPMTVDDVSRSAGAVDVRGRVLREYAGRFREVCDAMVNDGVLTHYHLEASGDEQNAQHPSAAHDSESRADVAGSDESAVSAEVPRGAVRPADTAVDGVVTILDSGSSLDLGIATAEALLAENLIYYCGEPVGVCCYRPEDEDCHFWHINRSHLEDEHGVPFSEDAAGWKFIEERIAQIEAAD
jgi:hypothetical protein